LPFLPARAASFPALMMERYPAIDGYTLRPDWWSGDGVWLIWPCRFEAWTEDYEHACLTVAGLARVLGGYHKVRVVVPGPLAPVAQLQLGRDVEIVVRQCDDSWIGDIGPHFLDGGDAEVAGVTCRFNGWGNRYHDYDNDVAFGSWLLDELGVSYYECPVTMEAGMVSGDGRGTLLASRQGVMDPHRNPTIDEHQLEEMLALYFGVRRIVWLNGVDVKGISGGQLVPVARFVGPGRVAVAVTDDDSSPHRFVLEENLETLRRFRDGRGEALSILEVPLPSAASAMPADRFPSYLGYRNFSGCLVVPGFDDETDERARDLLSAAFPGIPAMQVQMSVLAGRGTGLYGLLLPSPR
jgi:agmatine deiminase